MIREFWTENYLSIREKTQRFFRTHPLHQYFQKKGGDWVKAVENALKSEKCLTDGEREYTYSEIAQCSKNLELSDYGVICKSGYRGATTPKISNSFMPLFLTKQN